MTGQHRTWSETGSPGEGDAPLVFDASPVPMWIVDGETLRFLDVNASAVRHYGYSREQFLGMTVTDLEAPAPGAGEAQPSSRVQRHVTARGAVIGVRLETAAFPHRGRDARLTIVVDVTAECEAERAMRDREQRFLHLFETASDWYWESDARGCATFISSNFQALYGISAAELLGRRLNDHPDTEIDPETGQMALAAIKAQQPYRGLIYTHHLGSGRSVRVMASAVPRFDGAGVFCGYSGVSKDVTGQFEAERALRESEQRFRQLFEIAADYYFETDAMHRYSYVSPSYETLVGTTMSQIVGKRLTDLPGVSIDPEMGRRGVLALKEKRPYRDVVFSRVFPDGRKRWFKGSGTPIFGQDGVFTGYRGVGSEITQQIEAEQAWRLAQRRFDEAVANITQPFVIYDADDRITAANQAFADLHTRRGYTPVCQGAPYRSIAEWQLSNGFYAAEPEELAKTLDMLVEHYRSGDEHTYRLDDGRWMLVVYRPLPGGGRVGLWTDVTAIKRAVEERSALERQLQQSRKMEAVGQLTGGVAHDFNNLLAVLLGHLQLIEDEAEGAETVREWARAAIQVINRGATLTRSLLAFSRQQPLVPAEIELDAVVGQMTEIMRRTLGETIEIRVSATPDLWRCEADPGQLQNALLNLALNARDAMPDGGKLFVETGNVRLDADYAARHAGVTPGDFVTLAVSDTGTGMPAAVLDRVFEPFFTTKDVGKGSGLGLSMVYGFVNQSGGHIDIDSEVGRGTTVRIYLPRKLDARTAGAEPKTERVLRPGHETILLVEDNDDLRAVTQLQLRRLGYTVLGAANAAEGLAQLERHAETHLLLTDIVLPGGVDGIQLAERAKAVRPALEVVFMTGYTEHGALQDLAAAHPGRLLHKPFHSDDLASLIRAALDRR